MNALERWLVAACDALACGILALMAVVVFVEVTSRSVFGISTNVAEEVASLSLIVVLFLGLPGAFSQNALIRVDVLYRALGEQLRGVLDVGFSLVAACVTAVYIWYLADLAGSSFRFGFRTDSALGIPVYLPQSTMVAGVTALLVVVLISLSRRRERDAPEPGRSGAEASDGS